MSNKKRNIETVVILGESIDSLNFPILFKWAKENPETLASRLKSIAEAWHEGSVAGAVIALESDLE